MPMSTTAVEDFVVVGVESEAIRLQGGDGEVFLLLANELSDVFDSVVRLSFRAEGSAHDSSSPVPIVLSAIVTRDAGHQRQRVDVIQLKLVRA